MTINILGTKYTVNTIERDSDLRLEDCDGLCDDSVKEILLPVHYGEKDDKKDLPVVWKRAIRHEIVHAFLSESGLSCNSEWAENEEMVDWIAIQGLKIYKAWKEAGAID